VLVRLRAREEKLAESKCSVRIGVAYLQVNLKVVQRLGTSVVTKGCSMKMRAGLLGLRLGRRKRGRTWSRGILEERSACYGPDKRKGEGGPGQQHRPGNGGAKVAAAAARTSRGREEKKEGGGGELTGGSARVWGPAVRGRGREWQVGPAAIQIKFEIIQIRSNMV
jgi:hypothetical protein